MRFFSVVKVLAIGLALALAATTLWASPAGEEAMAAEAEMVTVELTRTDGTPISMEVEKPRYGGWATEAVLGGTTTDPTGPSHLAWPSQPPYDRLVVVDWARGVSGTGEFSTPGDVPQVWWIGDAAESFEQTGPTHVVFHIRRGIHFWDKENVVNPVPELESAYGREGERPRRGVLGQLAEGEPGLGRLAQLHLDRARRLDRGRRLGRSRGGLYLGELSAAGQYDPASGGSRGRGHGRLAQRARHRALHLVQLRRWQRRRVRQEPQLLGHGPAVSRESATVPRRIPHDSVRGDRGGRRGPAYRSDRPQRQSVRVPPGALERDARRDQPRAQLPRGPVAPGDIPHAPGPAGQQVRRHAGCGRRSCSPFRTRR